MQDHLPLALTPPSSSRRSGFARLLLGLWLVVLLYGGIYFPYPAESVPVLLLSHVLRAVAHASAALIRLWDPSVTVIAGPTISGRFPMQIVLDCAALDVQALYLAAVLAFPAALRDRVLGAALGVALLSALNIGRIAALYFVGSYSPTNFDVVHEDLLAFVMVAGTVATFAVWVRGVRRAADTSAT